MKLATIALASVFAVSSTFALAAQTKHRSTKHHATSCKHKYKSANRYQSAGRTQEGAVGMGQNYGGGWEATHPVTRTTEAAGAEAAGTADPARITEAAGAEADGTTGAASATEAARTTGAAWLAARTPVLTGAKSMRGNADHARKAATRRRRCNMIKLTRCRKITREAVNTPGIGGRLPR